MGEIRGELKNMNLSPDEAAWAVWRSHGGLPSNRSLIEGGPQVFKRLRPEMGAVTMRAALSETVPTNVDGIITAIDVEGVS